ncbi:MAG TPA: hypothetical protein VKU00_03335 [Chthonomonadaceae bacterium]|nr:hypothetical protein [Chthonomonadaceae bacterium]
MNATEKERILQMLNEGLLRPEEAARLLAALSEPAAPPPANKPEEKRAANGKEKAKEAPPEREKTREVQVQRSDGSYTTIQVPPHLAAMIWEVTKVTIADTAKTAAKETWSGFKNIVRRKTHEVTEGVKTRITGGGEKKIADAPPPPPTPSEEAAFEARRQILQMVQNGRITAEDAGRLIQELDAVKAYEKSRTTPPPAAPSAKSR